MVSIPDRENNMKVAELIKRLSRAVNIEFRDKDNNFICQTKSTSKGIDPYLEYNIFEWYPVMSIASTYICILLEDKGGGTE